MVADSFHRHRHVRDLGSLLGLDPTLFGAVDTHAGRQRGAFDPIHLSEVL